YYVVFNHQESYPARLGKSVVEQIRNGFNNGLFDQWKDKLNKIKIINKVLIDKEIKNSESYYLETILNSDYILNHVDDQGKPFYEDYSYLINFDNNKFDFYAYSKKINSYNFDNLPDFDYDC